MQMPMMACKGIAVLGLLVSLPPGPTEATQGPSAVWVGQDGTDLVGRSSKVGPSGVQDIRITLRGLPTNREIESINVRGHGRDEWRYKGQPGPYAAELVRKPGTSTAELYLEPTQIEISRSFHISIFLDDGRKAEFYIQGGRADPALRMPEAALAARWIGQDDQDRTGSGPSVGPDGRQDARIELAQLSQEVEVRSIKIETPGASGWCFGLNPEGLDNAELVRDKSDPARAELFLSPRADLAGQRLSIRVEYANGTSDRVEVVAGRVDPALAMPVPRLPRVVKLPIRATWQGQGETRGAGQGEVHVSLDGLPTDRDIVAAALSDSIRGAWVHRSEGVSFSAGDPERPLTWRRSGRLPRADLFFPPYRDETGATLTLRLLFQSGEMAIVRFEGGECDPTLRAPRPGPATATARPGDDLHSLVARGGTVRLSSGTYRLDRPLVLNLPVKIVGDSGSTLLFEQPKGAEPWTSAIKIHQGNTTLEGFAIRFSGPIQWERAVSYGPAILGTTDNRDPPGKGGTLVGLAFRRLNIESPPGSSDWEEAPRLLRLVSAEGGVIEENTFKGGLVEFRGGPWTILDNQHRGPLPGTFAYSAYSGHHTIDLRFERNTARPEDPSGKLWRFLVLTQSGFQAVVRDCEVAKVGPRDDDERPHPNAPEVVLTESYRLHFEGRPAALSEDGLILSIPEPQGTPAGTGSVVAVLSGPAAGRWVRIAQAIDDQTYRLDEPLPSGDQPIAMATGFVGMVFQGNRIDSRGSTIASNLVLAGNHFGARVRNNTLLGAGEAFRITASGSEQPIHWGWSRSPMLGLEIANNRIEDATRGGRLFIQHTQATKSSRGRVYLTATLLDNTAAWSPEFWREYGDEGPIAFHIGQGPTLDPGDLVSTMRGTRVQPPTGSRPKAPLRIEAAVVNGQEYLDRRFELELAAPAGANDARRP